MTQANKINKTEDSFGSLIELSWNGTKPIKLANGEERSFLHDGDEIIMRGFCESNGYKIGFGDLTERIDPSIKSKNIESK